MVDDVMIMVLWRWMFFGGGFFPPLKVSGGIPVFRSTRGQLFGTTMSHNHGWPLAPTSRKLFVWQIIWLDLSVTSRSTNINKLATPETSRMQQFDLQSPFHQGSPNHHGRITCSSADGGPLSGTYWRREPLLFFRCFPLSPKTSIEITVPQSTTIDISIKYTSILIQPANVDQSFFGLHQMPGWELMPFMVFHCRQLYRLYQ